jgi:hypothetical protein
MKNKSAANVLTHGKESFRMQKYPMSGECFQVSWITGDISDGRAEQ